MFTNMSLAYWPDIFLQNKRRTMTLVAKVRHTCKVFSKTVLPKVFKKIVIEVKN